MKEPVRYFTPYPFTIETLQRPGEPARYIISRARVGGRYSDELLRKEEAELLLHTLTREEADKEQLRYRIWQLEQQFTWAMSEIKERYEGPYEEWAPERARYNEALTVLRGIKQ
ncbi:hypothetical protein [Burkholderia territorii]|uniref:hypothetical protein n=1 Tax=Burkholderia territorii TaxID=1503055 RepID=UPI00075476F2|nr:hypothetical protein [Burkholderia territorii]KVL49995.1 hypothetical protein WT00_18770 [Burkholderia territorii]